jgi:hypothetical protein
MSSTPYTELANRLAPYLIEKFKKAGNGTSGTSSSASWRPPRVFYSEDYGLAGLGADEASLANSFLAQVAAQGGGIAVFASRDPNGYFVFDATVNVFSNNTHVVFAPSAGANVKYTANTVIRIMGEFDEFTRNPSGNKLKLRAASFDDANSRMVLPLATGEGAYLLVGDKITVRGQNDINGKAIQKQTTFVYSIVGDDVTCVDESDYTFQPTYPQSEYPPDLTTGTTIAVVRYSNFTTDISAGAASATVTDASIFSVGDVVYVSDGRVEHDVQPNSARVYRNAAVMEYAKIVGITGNVISFEHALERSYLTSFYGGVSRVLPVRHSSISGVVGEWLADGASRSQNALQVGYGYDCQIHDCYLDGANGRKGHAIRISNSYRCAVYRNHIDGAKFFDSGEGYGITCYYSTNCDIRQNYINGCRHNILFQAATNCRAFENYCDNDYVSSIDGHSANSQGLHIFNNVVTRSRGRGGSVTSGTLVTTAGGIRIGNGSHVCGDHNVVVEGNWITRYNGTSADLPECSAIDIYPSSRDVTVRNNQVIDCTNGIELHAVSNTVPETITGFNWLFQGNRLLRCTNPVKTNSSTTNSVFDRITFEGNIDEGNANHFELNKLLNLKMLNNAVIHSVNTAAKYGINAKNCTNITISGNKLDGCNRGINIENCGATIVEYNALNRLLETEVFRDGGGNNGSLVRYNTDLLNVGIPAYTITTSTGITIARASKITTIRATLADNTTTTSVIPIDNTLPDRTLGEGLEIITTNYSVVNRGGVIKVTCVVPTMEISVTTNVALALFVEDTCIGVQALRVTTGGSSGEGIICTGEFIATADTHTISARIGVRESTTTLTLKSKFAALGQPLLVIEE